MRIKVGARCNVPLHRICEYILTNLFRWHLEKENTYREGKVMMSLIDGLEVNLNMNNPAASCSVSSY